MENTRWVYEKYTYFINDKKDMYIDNDIKNILINREITDKKSIVKFLDPKIDDISSPFLLKDMDKAVERIIKGIESKENIWIYGDYDVDGITSTSLLYITLKKLGADIHYYIPLRDEGYGLNKDAISQIKEQGGSLIITVDCGISSPEEVDFCNSLNMEMIITDHHEINNDFPNAYAVINPKREDNIYKFKYLAGVGTAFMLAMGIYDKLNKKDEILKYMDIVAIGTIADIVPLIEENRIFAKIGLEQLKSSMSIGVNMLVRFLFSDWESRKFTTFDIGFILAPVFNAVGRLEDAKKAVELFTETEIKKLNEIIKDLIEKNKERKEIQENIYESVLKKIEKEHLAKNNILIVGDEKFHHGVIGIVASKITDKYCKPSIVYEIKTDEGIAVASCRSIQSFDITAALTQFSDLLVKYGGHAGAAGFTISLDKLNEFTQKLCDHANNVIKLEDMVNIINIERELPIYKISYDFLEKLSRLEPFGFGNQAPVFSLNDCTCKNVRLIGKNKNHLMMDIIKDGHEIRNNVWFGAGEYISKIKNMKKIDVAFKLKLESYKEIFRYKLFIVDLKESSKDADVTKNINNSNINIIKDSYNLFNVVFPIETVIYTRKKINTDKFNLNFDSENITVMSQRQPIDILDSKISYLLRNLNEMYGYNFNVVLDKIVKTSENYNVFIKIFKDTGFDSCTIKPERLFNEIKRFLIGDFSYNDIQKKIFNMIFREKKNVVAYIREGRGINTILKTISLYYKNINKNPVIIDNNNMLSNEVRDYSALDDSIKEGYDYYMLIDPNKDILNNVSNIPNSKMLIIPKDTEFEVPKDFVMIKDEYNIPQNLKIMDKIYPVLDPLLKEALSKNIFVDFLPRDEKERLLHLLKDGKEIFSTPDILPYL